MEPPETTVMQIIHTGRFVEGISGNHIRGLPSWMGNPMQGGTPIKAFLDHVHPPAKVRVSIRLEVVEDE
jgi:hypothetical protein